MAAQQIDKMFASMSFEGEDIDPELMAKVMAKMRNDLCAEAEPQNQPSTNEITTVVEEQTLPSPPIVSNNNMNEMIIPPSSDTTPIQVCLLRFDGVKETQEFSMNVSLNESADQFKQSILETKSLNLNGMTRMDMGSPDSISPISLVQPMWQTMREVMDRMQSQGLSDKITLHYYPIPPIASESSDFIGSFNTEIKANWLRIVTLTRKSIFIHYNSISTTILDMKREIESLAGIAMEWQRIMLSNGKVIDNHSDDGMLLSEFDSSITPAMNLFLTHRIEGVEYGGDGAALK